MVSSRSRVALTLLLAACSQDDKPLTQLMLVADTDIPTINTVQFLIESEDKSRKEMATVTRQGGEPAYVGVVRDTGTLGPLTVIALGFQNEMLRMQRVQRVSFVPDETRVVRLHLLASCVGVQCTSDQTCGETGCTTIDVPAEKLDTWVGSAPELRIDDIDGGTPQDAGVRDAGRDAATDAGASDAGDAHVGDARTAEPDASDSAVTDAGSDAGTDLTQCDGGAYNLKSDPYHCGTCTGRCNDGPSSYNSIFGCVNGSCTSSYVCQRGYANCDGYDLLNGCEVYLLNDESHCGACNVKCATGQTCVTGVCQ